MAKGLKARFEPIWYLNQMFYLGDQWVFWNRGRLDRPRLDPWRVTLTDNRIVGVVRTELAKMTKTRPAFQVVPNTGEQGDLDASEVGEKILNYLWRDLSLRDRLEDALLWSRITGAGFWKITWDSAKGQKVQVLADPEGKPIIHPELGVPIKPDDMDEDDLPEGTAPKTIATGDVHVEVVSPFELYPDPIARRMEDCEWVVQKVVKSPDWVKQRFGQDLPPDADVAAGPAEARLFPSWQMGGASGYKGVTVNEYWCKPNDVHPNGRRVVWAQQKILEEGDNPYKCLPYVMFTGIPVPGRFWPTSIVEQLKSPQTELNKTISQITENAQRIGNPALMVARQANVQYSGTPGERIDFDDTVQNATPAYLQAPQMPQYVLQQLERAEKSMEAIAAQHEVSNAQVPAGVKAASAINLLQEADDTRLGPAIYAMEETLGKAGEMLLELVSKYWTDTRTIQIAGEDKAWSVEAFKGDSLKGNTRVEVQSGSALPRSKAARQAAIQDMLNLYFQYRGNEPMDNRMVGKVLKDLDAGGLEKLFGDISVDETQISRENGEISLGNELAINVYDNHKAHIAGHEEFQKQAGYQTLPEGTRVAMERHIALHREQLVQELAPEGAPQIGPGGPQGAPGPQGAGGPQQAAPPQPMEGK